MWFSAGLVLALGFCLGTLAWRAQAAPGASESTIVSVTPARVLDTRTDLGLVGPFASLVPRKLQLTGPIATRDGTATVVPVGATGVLLNVTVVSDGSWLPLDTSRKRSRPPDTSSLNFTARQTVPNAVQVTLPPRWTQRRSDRHLLQRPGQPGPTTHVVIDVVGYTTNAGLQELVADVAKANTAAVNAGLAAKANSADVYQGPVRWPISAGVRHCINSLPVTNWTIGWSRGRASALRGWFRPEAGVLNNESVNWGR